jgi:hypothetical protein
MTPGVDEYASHCHTPATLLKPPHISGGRHMTYLGSSQEPSGRAVSQGLTLVHFTDDLRLN